MYFSILHGFKIEIMHIIVSIDLQ